MSTKPDRSSSASRRGKRRRGMRPLGKNALLLAAALLAACTPLQVSPAAAVSAANAIESSSVATAPAPAPALLMCPERGPQCTGKTEGNGSYARHALFECRRHQSRPLLPGETAAMQAEAVERCIMQVKGSRYCQCQPDATATPPQ